MATNILKEEVPGLPRIVTGEQLGDMLSMPRRLTEYRCFQTIRVSSIQLRTIAKYVSIIPRHTPLEFLLREERVRRFVTMEPGLLAAAVDKSELCMPSLGYRIVMSDMGDTERATAIAVARGAGFKEETLSLPTALTAMVLSHLLLGRSPTRTYVTRSRLCSGQYFAVGPDGHGRITVRPAFRKIFPPAIGFVHS